jgi:hypothetical protein
MLKFLKFYCINRNHTYTDRHLLNLLITWILLLVWLMCVPSILQLLLLLLLLLLMLLLLLLLQALQARHNQLTSNLIPPPPRMFLDSDRMLTPNIPDSASWGGGGGCRLVRIQSLRN